MLPLKKAHTVLEKSSQAYNTWPQFWSVFLKSVGTSAVLQGVSSHVRLKRLHTLFSTYGVQSSFMVAIERCTELHKRPISTPNPTAWILSDSTCQTHLKTQQKKKRRPRSLRNAFMTIKQVEGIYFNTLSFIRSLCEQESVIAIGAFHS